MRREEKKEPVSGSRDGKEKLSDEELARLVSTSLSSEWSSRSVPVWFIRVLSVLAGLVALLLLFLLFR